MFRRPARVTRELAAELETVMVIYVSNSAACTLNHISGQQTKVAPVKSKLGRARASRTFLCTQATGAHTDNHYSRK